MNRAYHCSLPADAKVLAKYNDGKPTIIERTVGKGKVIFSAVLPFGTSEAALVPGGWNVPLNAQVPINKFALPYGIMLLKYRMAAVNLLHSPE